MRGVNVSQGRAEELAGEFEVYLDSATGFWVRTDSVSQEKLTYRVYKTGDQVQDIPDGARAYERG